VAIESSGQKLAGNHYHHSYKNNRKVAKVLRPNDGGNSQSCFSQCLITTHLQTDNRRRNGDDQISRPSFDDMPKMNIYNVAAEIFASQTFFEQFRARAHAHDFQPMPSTDQIQLQ
jgi:hypothetical protein